MEEGMKRSTDDRETECVSPRSKSAASAHVVDKDIDIYLYDRYRQRYHIKSFLTRPAGADESEGFWGEMQILHVFAHQIIINRFNVISSSSHLFRMCWIKRTSEQNSIEKHNIVFQFERESRWCSADVMLSDIYWWFLFFCSLPSLPTTSVFIELCPKGNTSDHCCQNAFTSDRLPVQEPQRECWW